MRVLRVGIGPMLSPGNESKVESMKEAPMASGQPSKVDGKANLSKRGETRSRGFKRQPIRGHQRKIALLTDRKHKSGTFVWRDNERVRVRAWFLSRHLSEGRLNESGSRQGASETNIAPPVCRESEPTLGIPSSTSH